MTSSMLLLNFISSKMTAKEYEEGMINLHFMATNMVMTVTHIVAETMTMRLQRQNNGKMI